MVEDPVLAEALRLRWSDVGERSIWFHATKTRTRRVRAARLMAPVRADLVGWRLVSAPQTDDTLVFPRPDGEEWRKDDWDNWRNRVFRPALTAVGSGVSLGPGRLEVRSGYQPAAGGAALVQPQAGR